jgi:hypothetical protein
MIVTVTAPKAAQALADDANADSRYRATIAFGTWGADVTIYRADDTNAEPRVVGSATWVSGTFGGRSQRDGNGRSFYTGGGTAGVRFAYAWGAVPAQFGGVIREDQRSVRALRHALGLPTT